MSAKIPRGFIGGAVLSLFAAFFTGPAVSQEAVELRYGFEKGRQYGYDVKIVAQFPDEEITHQGSFTYTVLSASADQFMLKCWGNLGKSVKANPDSEPSSPFGRGFGGPPRIPGPPGFGGPRGFGGPPGFGPMSEPMRPEGTTFNRQGGIVTFGNTSSLPVLLGNQADFVIEALPAEAKTNWTKETDIGVIERSESNSFFRPFGPGSASETSHGAKERIDYAILETKPDSVRVSKTYSIKTAADAGGKNHIDMSGSGEFEFDRKEGVITSQTIKYDIKINEKNVAVTIPVTVTYTRVSDTIMAERKQKAEEAAAAHAEAQKPKPLAPGEREKLLVELRSSDEKRIQTAAQRLGKSFADDKPEEISKALCLAYKKTNPWIQRTILDALAIWHAPDAERTVIEACGSTHFFVRDTAIGLLGKFKTETAAKAVVDNFKKNPGAAIAAFKAMGPFAESYALPFLKDEDFFVRKDICGLLGEIGGKRSMAVLKSGKAKLPWNEGTYYDAAILAIEKRVGPGDEDPPAETEEQAKNDKPAKTEEQPKKTVSTAPEMRTWTDSTGTYKIEATFVKQEGDKATIRRADGKTITMPIAKLSKADQEYIRQQAKIPALDSENPFE